MINSLVDSLVALAALVAIGVGLWLHDPSYALVVVGGIVFGLVVYVRTQRGKVE